MSISSVTELGRFEVWWIFLLLLVVLPCVVIIVIGITVF